MIKNNQLTSSIYFSTPVFYIEIPEWVDNINKICDKYIKDAKKSNKKFNKKIGDHGMSYHSTSLIGDPSLKELQDYIGLNSCNI